MLCRRKFTPAQAHPGSLKLRVTILCRGLGHTLRNHVILALTTEVCERVRKYTPYNLSNRSVVSLVSLHSRSCEDLVTSVIFIKTFIIHLEDSLGYFLLRPENSRKRGDHDGRLVSII